MSEKRPRGRPEEIEIDLTTLGGRIRAARKKKGRKLKETAAAAHIQHPSLIDIEKGRTTPTERTLVLLAEYLDEPFGEEWLTDHLLKKKQEAVAAGRRKRVTHERKTVPILSVTEREEVALILHYRDMSLEERDMLWDALIKGADKEDYFAKLLEKAS